MAARIIQPIAAILCLLVLAGQAQALSQLGFDGSAQFPCGRTEKATVLQIRASVSRVGFIACLLSHSCPPAISWLIAPVVVDAVQRVARWSPSHVGEETRKAFAPTITDDYPPASIPCVIPYCGPVATIQHIHPCSIFRPTVAAPTCSMLETELSSRYHFRVKAATTARVAPPQVLTDHQHFRTAFADTLPNHVRSGKFSGCALINPNNREASKCSA